MDKKKKWYKKWWVWIVIIFALGLIGSFGDDEEVSEESTSEVAAKEVKQKELTIDEKVKKAVIKAVKDETNTDKKRIVSIVVENNAAKVILNGDESLTVKLTKDAMLIDSKDVFAELDKIEELTSYHLTWNMPLVDVKGNVEDHQVIKIIMDKGHGVTWENFNIDNFDKVSTSFFVHLAYRK